METAVGVLAIIGLVALCIACSYIIFQLMVIHKLVNSRLQEALSRIDKLEKLLLEGGQSVPS